MSQTSGVDDSELSDCNKDNDENDILHSSSKEETNEVEDLQGNNNLFKEGEQDGELSLTDSYSENKQHGTDTLIQEGDQDGLLAMMGSSSEEKQPDTSFQPSKGPGKKEVKQKKPRKKRSSFVERPDSPTTQRIQQRLRYAIIQDACNELVKMRSVNGGPKHGDLSMIVKKYNNELGHSFVTRAVLNNKLIQNKTSKFGGSSGRYKQNTGPKDDDSFYSAEATEQEGQDDRDSGASTKEPVEPKKGQRKMKTQANTKKTQTVATKKKRQAVAVKKNKQSVAMNKKRKKLSPKTGGNRSSSSFRRKRRRTDDDFSENEDDDESSDSAIGEDVGALTVSTDDEDDGESSRNSTEDEDDESSESSYADRVQRMIHKSVIDDAYGELLTLPGGASTKNIKMVVEMYQDLGQTFVTQAAIKKRITGEVSLPKVKSKKSTGISNMKKPAVRSASQQAKNEAYQLRQAIIRQAFRDLLALRASHGGESYYGDVPKILKIYHEKGHTFVTRAVLKHRLKRLAIEKEREENQAKLTAADKIKKKKEAKVRVEPTSNILKEIFDEAHAVKKLSSEAITNVNNLDATVRKEIVLQAFDELMELRESNGGTKRYGDVQTIVRKYRRDGYDFITRSVLKYQFHLRKKLSDGQGALDNYQPKDANREASSSETKKKVQKAEVNKKKTPKKASSKTKLKPKDNKKKITSRIKNKILDFETDNKVKKALVKNKKPTIKASSTSNLKTSVKKLKITDRIKNKIPDFEAKVKEGTTKCAELLAQERARLCVTGSQLKSSAFRSMIDRVEKELGLPPNSINGITVSKRVARNNLTGECLQKISPLKDIEPTIIHYCHRLLKMGVELEKHQVKLLIESLIRGTIHRQRLIAFKKNSGRVYGEAEPVVGDKVCYSFMKRNHDALALSSNLLLKRNLSAEWCTYDNLKALYNCVYDAMVDEARVAIRLDDVTSFDREGNQVEPGHASAAGLPTHYMVTKPNNIVYINEIDAISFSGKVQNAVVGHKVVLPIEQEIPSVDDKSDNNIVPPISATVLCFSSGSGIPILCAVIFQSESRIRDLPYSWKYGIDITKQLKEGSTIDAEDILWSQNSGDGDAMAGGPVCYFEGKRIPCYTDCSPTGSINSEMFVYMLKYLDGLNIFDRSDGTKPFLLLDGHHCILDLPLINYVYDHGWVLRLGLPYGLNYWQRPSTNNNTTPTAPGANMYPIVLDHNGGVFGKALTEAQHKYMNLKSSCTDFQKSDFIPIINHAWSNSLGDVEMTRNIIRDRGWGPLTYNILQHPKVIVTVSATEIAEGQREHEADRHVDASEKNEDQLTQEGGPLSSNDSLAAAASDYAAAADETQPAQEGRALLSNDSLAAAATDGSAEAEEEEVRPALEGGPLSSNDTLSAAATDDEAAAGEGAQPEQEDNLQFCDIKDI